MKLISYWHEATDRAAILAEGKVYPLSELDKRLPDNMRDFLLQEETGMQLAKTYDQKIKSGEINKDKSLPVDQVKLLAPVPHPTSCRDAYAFRQHVAAARKNRGVEMIPEFDQFPIFYFTNHNAITGPGELDFMPDHFHKLDFELEVAVVIGKKGRNISAKEAGQYIAGYTIMNDWSARRMQMEEMKLNLGPAKGKDFATTIGPWLVTPDELEAHKVSAKEGHTGINYDLKMQCWVNGEQVSEGTLGDIDWTFAEIIERVSYGVDIWPGDVIGSGTVGTGCFLELNGTARRLDPDNFQPRWIQPGDTVEMEIAGLGRLYNTVKKAGANYSVLALKKNVEAVD